MFEGVYRIMQPIDSDIRRAIIEQQGNIIISASAGTGKTHTTIEKITYDSKYNCNYRTFAAITFTRKATKEIIERLSIDNEASFIGTNDTFALEEIVRPFMYDVYGREYKIEIKPDYSTSNQINRFEDGAKKILESGFICKYVNQKVNYTFQLALYILKNSEACKLYLKSKYYKIYIDEYQDCDKDMHQLFLYINKYLDIPLFIVGDLKQSIYRWRGGYDEGFRELWKDDCFTTYKLSHNFRSVQGIQNYASIFMDEIREDFRNVEFDDSVHCAAYWNELLAIEKIREWVGFSQKCAFLIRTREEGKRWSEQLKLNKIEFTFIPGSPLDNGDMESEHIWIARQIAFFILKKGYSEYDFYDEIPNSDAFMFNGIRKILMAIDKVKKEQIDFFEWCIKLYNFLGFEFSNKIQKEIEMLFSVIENEEYIPTYNSEEYEHIITTIHSAKGLQFPQVMLLADNYNLTNENDINLHYVGVTRPQYRLLILVDYRKSNGKVYCNTLNNNIKKLEMFVGEITRDEVVKCTNLN